MTLCVFFSFVYVFLELVSMAGPQAQTQFFTQNSAVGFLWEENTSDTSVHNAGNSHGCLVELAFTLSTYNVHRH